VTQRWILYVKFHGSVTQNNLQTVPLQMVAKLALTLYRIDVAILPVTMATERQRRTNKRQIWKGAWSYRQLVALLHLKVPLCCYYGNYFFSIGRVLLVMWHTAIQAALYSLVQTQDASNNISLIPHNIYNFMWGMDIMTAIYLMVLTLKSNTKYQAIRLFHSQKLFPQVHMHIIILRKYP
jgi:hypothetical protein